MTNKKYNIYDNKFYDMSFWMTNKKYNIYDKKDMLLFYSHSAKRCVDPTILSPFMMGWLLHKIYFTYKNIQCHNYLEMPYASVICI